MPAVDEMKCPKCGSTKFVCSTTAASVCCDDGVSTLGEYTVEENDTCWCGKCDHQGSADEFNVAYAAEYRGGEAFEDDKPLSENPYPEDLDPESAYQQWIAGWNTRKGETS